MNLNEFLKTADADDALALIEARNHIEYRANLLSSNVMSMILVDAELYDAFKADDREPVHAFMDRVLTTSEFNFYEPSLEGAANFALLDDLVGDPALRTTLTEYGREASSPFANATLYDVKRERGTLSEVVVNAVGGFAVINVTTVVERHNPIIEAVNSRTGKRERVAAFSNVSTAGKYDARIGAEWRKGDLFVLDAYGVIGAA
jgi:hypothetical protein